MKVLLTGYSGFLGRYLGKKLLKEGFTLRVLLHRHTLARKEMQADVEVVWGAVDDAPTIRKAVDGVDCIVHSAWAFSSPFENRPTINERAADVLLSESVQAGVKKFALISSVAVYGMTGKQNSKIKETNAVATGKDLSFIYPSEKINVERTLLKFDPQRVSLAIFRSGPIFDDMVGPAKKVMKIGPKYFGIGIGNGRNKMAYIHANDVEDAVAQWLLSDGGRAIFNIVPGECLSFKEWIKAWGFKRNIVLKPVFIPGVAILTAGLASKTLKKIMGKQSKGDIRYAIACAKRDICYSNEFIGKTLNWEDKATTAYTGNAKRSNKNAERSSC